MGIKLEYQEPGIYEMACDCCKEEQFGSVKIAVICERCGEKLKKTLKEIGVDFEIEIKNIIE